MILRDTLEIALAADDAFAARFYDRLFAAHPELRPMFHRHSAGAQHKMFAQKLTAIVDHIDEPQWLERELPALARTHDSYGVTAEMYAWVGDALIATVADACGDRWTPAAHDAWQAAYAAVASAMLRPR